MATFTDISETELVGVEEHTDPNRSFTLPVKLTKTSENSQLHKSRGQEEEWFFGRVGMPGLETNEYCVDYFGFKDIDPHRLYDKTEEIRRG